MRPIAMQKESAMLKILLLMLMSIQCPALAAAAEMTVSGAASLTNAFTEMQREFAKSHPDMTVNTSFAASNTLLRQLVEGAPVDVFASADQQTMDKAASEQIINPQTRKNFAVNDLVLIVPKGAAKPAKLDDLLNMRHIAIGNPDSVPAGRYAKTSLEKANLWKKLENKYVLAASVRQALDYVARGEVDAGFVYATDARQMADKVDVAMLVEGHDPVSYPIAVAITGNNLGAGQEFVDFVLSPAGQAILAKYGFSKP